MVGSQGAELNICKYTQHTHTHTIHLLAWLGTALATTSLCPPVQHLFQGMQGTPVKPPFLIPSKVNTLMLLFFDDQLIS